MRYPVDLRILMMWVSNTQDALLAGVIDVGPARRAPRTMERSGVHVDEAH